MRTVKLTRLGLCGICEIWLEIENHASCLPKHLSKEGDIDCKHSFYSTSGDRYLIKTEKEAQRVASFIKDDDGHCLEGRRLHSMMCADGENCAIERLHLAQALAVYYLENTKQ